jgi:hypothetical protein
MLCLAGNLNYWSMFGFKPFSKAFLDNDLKSGKNETAILSGIFSKESDASLGHNLHVEIGDDKLSESYCTCKAGYINLL